MDLKLKFACDLCFEGATEIGELCDGFALILHEGQYKILWGYGHKDFVLFVFDHKPVPDPFVEDPNYKPGDPLRDFTPEEREWNNRVTDFIDRWGMTCKWRR